MINPYVVIGLGKTGISCVRYLVNQGHEVIAVDTRDQPSGASDLQREYPEIKLCLGKIPTAIIENAAEVIVSPGLNLPDISGINDIELFARAVKAPIVAITGSNGKSTVTALVGAMAQEAGLNVGVGGNLGKPALDLLADERELYVLELSSFQLERTQSLQPAAATVLNISPDHLDRYKTMEKYLAAKLRIYNGCKTAVVNRQCRDCWPQDGVERVSGRARHAVPLHISFGTDVPKSNQFGINNGYICHGDKKIIKNNELKIKGKHQLANACAALALGSAVNLPIKAMTKALRNFSGLEHRCQWLGEINRVAWYNDSKATNVGAAEAAITGIGSEISGKLILIMGGQGKNGDFTPLQLPIAKFARTVILIGEDADKLRNSLAKCCELQDAVTLQQAVKLAAKTAQNGDVVLLSPACASFDMFDNFEHRGNEFIKYVDAYRKEQTS